MIRFFLKIILFLIILILLQYITSIKCNSDIKYVSKFILDDLGFCKGGNIYITNDYVLCKQQTINVTYLCENTNCEKKFVFNKE